MSPQEAGGVYWEKQEDPDPVRGYAAELAQGVKANKDHIDALIEAHSQHWKLYRMSRIDRNILRIAVYELTSCPDVPPKVCIDEAVEIGKKFGTTESGAFINGILDQVCRRLGRLVSPGNEPGPPSGPKNDPESNRDPE
jgi:N utilization substance protein B